LEDVTMEVEVSSWWNTVISVVPFILLIGFWIYFMRKGGLFKQQREYMDRSRAHMERMEQLLDRVAVALEARARN